MASFRSRLEQHLAHQLYASYDEEDPAAVPQTTFGRVMVFDARKISDSVVSFYNDDVVNGFDFQIFGSLKHVDLDNSQCGPVIVPETSAPGITDESWQNIIPDPKNKNPHVPASNNQAYFKTIPARTAAVGWHYESFSNKWAWIQILARTDKVGGLNAKIHHRGTNES